MSQLPGDSRRAFFLHFNNTFKKNPFFLFLYLLWREGHGVHTCTSPSENVGVRGETTHRNRFSPCTVWCPGIWQQVPAPSASPWKMHFLKGKKQSLYSYSRGINKRGLQFLSCVGYSLLWPQGQRKGRAVCLGLGLQRLQLLMAEKLADGRSERTAREAGPGYSTSGPALLVHFSQGDSASQRFYRVLKQHHHLETRGPNTGACGAQLWRKPKHLSKDTGGR